MIYNKGMIQKSNYTQKLTPWACYLSLLLVFRNRFYRESYLTEMSESANSEIRFSDSIYN